MNFDDYLQNSFGRLLDVIPEPEPMVIQAGQRQTAYRQVFASKPAWGQPFSVPFVGANGPHDVFGWRDGQVLGGELLGKLRQFGVWHLAFRCGSLVVKFGAIAVKFNLDRMARRGRPNEFKAALIR